MNAATIVIVIRRVRDRALAILDMSLRRKRIRPLLLVSRPRIALLSSEIKIWIP